MAPSYKLYYFNMRARAEMTRWVFALAGQEYEDVRFELADWPSIKPTTPSGQAPYLELNGKFLTQSVTIARFVARELGLAGANSWEAAQIDALVDYWLDAAKPLSEWVTATVTGDKETAEKIKHQYPTKDIVPFLKELERRLQSNNGGKGFFIGTKASWGDIVMVTFEDELVRLNPSALEQFALLKAHAARVHDLKGIKEWIAKRPETIV